MDASFAHGRYGVGLSADKRRFVFVLIFFWLPFWAFWVFPFYAYRVFGFMLNVGLMGWGRMGRAFFDAAQASPDVHVVRVVDPAARDVPAVVSVFGPHAPAFDGLDAVVDFSSPAGLAQTVDLACQAGVPVVSGVTGVASEADAALRRRIVDSKNRAVFSPNFSFGVAAFLQAAAFLSRTLSGYDVEIIEMHHRNKVDAPSGTASRLAADVVQAAGKSGLVHGRHGRSVRANEVGVHAVRAGDFFGDHLLLLAGPGEHIELRHSAHSRGCFAAGALWAVRFAVQAQPGVYAMDDVVGFAAQSVAPVRV